LEQSFLCGPGDTNHSLLYVSVELDWLVIKLRQWYRNGCDCNCKILQWPSTFENILDFPARKI